MKFLNILAAIFVLTILFGCETTPSDYSNTSPEFDLKQFFTGDLKGWGLVSDYRGKVTQRFTVDMEGSWNGDKGELYELFSFQNGDTQERTWILEKKENGINIGTANDVIGEAVGQQNGYAFYWEYDLLINTETRNLKVQLQDWLYQINQDAIISKAKIKKFGFPVGEVIVFILREEKAS